MKKYLLLLLIPLLIGCQKEEIKEEQKEKVEEPTHIVQEEEEDKYVDTNPIKVGLYKDGKLIKEIKHNKKEYIALQGDTSGKYLTYVDSKNLYIYNIKNNKVVGSISTKDNYSKNLYYSSDSNYVFAMTNEEDYDLKKEDYSTIHVIRTKDAKETNSVELNAAYVSGILTKGDNA